MYFVHRWDLNSSAREDVEGIREMSRHLGQLVADLESECGVGREKIVLGGFSMGGHMALQAVYGAEGVRVGDVLIDINIIETISL